MGFYLQMSFPIRLCSVNVSILFNIKEKQRNYRHFRHIYGIWHSVDLFVVSKHIEKEREKGN